MKTAWAILLFISLATLSGCKNVLDEFYAAAASEEATQWAYLQLNVPYEGGDIDSYYYYAKISPKMFRLIKTNQIAQGFLYLEDVHYYSDEDTLIHSLKSIESSGDLIFRIEHLVKLETIAQAPVAGLGLDQYDETSQPSENQ